MAADEKSFEIVGLSPSSPTGNIGQVVRVNPNGIAYMRVPKYGKRLDVCCYKTGDKIQVKPSAIPRVRWNTNLAQGRVDADEKLVTFTFDKILNYAGQSAEQIGLKEGTVVEFEAPEGVVQSVKLM